MTNRKSNGIGTKFLIIFASIIVIFAGMKAAQSLVAPFLLAIFFAMVLLPPLRWLKQKGLSDWVALSVLSFLVFLFGIALVWVVSYSLTDFADRLPNYQTKINAGITQLDHGINNILQKFDQIEKSVPKIPLFQEESDESILPTETAQLEETVTADDIPVREPFSLLHVVHLDTFIGYIHLGVRELLNIATVSSLIVVMVIFMLIEAARLPEKVREAFSGRDLSNEYFKKIAEDTWNYMKIKTIINVLTGLVTAIGLWLLGVDYAFLWGILMFFLNYIPNIGQIIASIPPVLLALLDQGATMAFVVTFWLVAVNTVFGYGVEPRYLEKGLGISGLVVLLSLIFWGWLLG
ncbi:MAG: AI-2E family transporter, partial [Planctomycetaceae bacterium]|nr:AI-2E family transporter [Planctomycetaceae bacterium]